MAITLTCTGNAEIWYDIQVVPALKFQVSTWTWSLPAAPPVTQACSRSETTILRERYSLQGVPTVYRPSKRAEDQEAGAVGATGQWPVQPEARARGRGDAAANIAALISAKNADICNKTDIRISWYLGRCSSFFACDVRISWHHRSYQTRCLLWCQGRPRYRGGKKGVDSNIGWKNCDITAQNSDIGVARKGST